jgi:hypothetical protein
MRHHRIYGGFALPDKLSGHIQPGHSMIAYYGSKLLIGQVPFVGTYGP